MGGRQPPGNMDFLNRSKEYLDATLKKSVAYSPATRLAVRTQVIDVQQQYPGLGAVIRRQAADGSNNTQGRLLEIIVMDGTVPIQYKNSSYNIPVSIRLPQGFPDIVPPMCYVTPTEDLVLKPNHPVVDSTGLCSLPGFRAGEWQSSRSSLKSAIQEMVRQFSMNPPLYAAPGPKPGVAATPTPIPSPTPTSHPHGLSPVSSPGSISSVKMPTGGSFFPSVVTAMERRPQAQPPVQLSAYEEGLLVEAMTSMGIDDLTPPNLSLFKEQVDFLVAKDTSLEDGIEDAGEQLRQEKIDVEAYLKKVRQITFDQFLVRAKLAKLQPAVPASEKKLKALEAVKLFEAEQARAREEEEKRKREAEEAARERVEQEQRKRLEAAEAARKLKEAAEKKEREEAAIAAAAEASRRQREEDLRKKQEADAAEARRRWQMEQDRIQQQQQQVQPPGPISGPSAYAPYRPPQSATSYAAPTSSAYTPPGAPSYYQPRPPGPTGGPSYQNPGGMATHTQASSPYGQQQQGMYMQPNMNQGYMMPPPPPGAGAPYQPYSQPPPGYGQQSTAPTVISAFTGLPSGVYGQAQAPPPQQQYMPPPGPIGTLTNLWNQYARR